MKNLPVSVGKIKVNLNCKESEEEELKEIAKTLNKEVNTIALETGRLDDIFLLISLIFIKINKITGRIENFENHLVEMLRIILPYVENCTKKDELEEKLVLLSIIKENEIRQNKDSPKVFEKKITESLHYKEMTELIEAITELIERLANNINTL